MLVKKRKETILRKHQVKFFTFITQNSNIQVKLNIQD